MSIFKCSCCGMKYDHKTMASDEDVSICKWCAGEIKENEEIKEEECHIPK